MSSSKGLPGSADGHPHLNFPLLLEQLREAHDRQIEFMQAEMDRLANKCRSYDGSATQRSDKGKRLAVDDSEKSSKAEPANIQQGVEAMVDAITDALGTGATSDPDDVEPWDALPLESSPGEEAPTRNTCENEQALRDADQSEEDTALDMDDGNAVGEKVSVVTRIKSTTVSHLYRGKSGRHNSFLQTPHGPAADTVELSFSLLARSYQFEIFFAVLIVIMAIVMAAEAEYTGTQLDLESAGRNHELANDDFGTKVFKTIGHIFGTLFAIELIVQILGKKKAFFKDAWNWFDCLLVMLWVCELLFPGQFSNVQLLRMLRLCRLARLIRLVRTITYFDDLYLIVTALRGSFRVLAWTMLVFAVFQVTVALGLCNLLRDFYLDNPDYPLNERSEVYTYFGTFGRSMLSVFEIVLGNWVPVCRKLTENVSLWFIAFGIIHKMIFGFAMIGVINGVFTQETFKIAAADDTLMMRRKHNAKELHEKKMRQLFNRADVNKNGSISLDEFKELMQEKQLKLWLSSMELDIHDLEKVFYLLDTSLGESDNLVSCEELISGCARLRGYARSIDMAHLSVEIETVRKMCLELKDMITTQSNEKDGKVNEQQSYWLALLGDIDEPINSSV